MINATVSRFQSHGTDCAGRLFLPATGARPPVVVMGHGLGALQQFRLPDYAERFVQRGLAVFTFDYRHWGLSDGQPRQLLVPKRQLQDWQAALTHVRGLPQVDGSRLAVWGSSFGGAHVIQVAARDHHVAAVVAQVPAADTARAAAGVQPVNLLKMIGAGLLDTLRGLLGVRPLYVPLVGAPGEFAVMNTPECRDGYLPLVPPDANWKNEVAARSLLLLPLYRAIRVAGQVTAPTLLLAGKHDSLVAIEDVRALAERLPRAELREYDCNHFAPYYAPLFDSFVTTQADFLATHLRP